MFKTGLQLFAEAVSGKKIVYLYRLAGKAKEEAAKNLAFTTENGRLVHGTFGCERLYQNKRADAF